MAGPTPFGPPGQAQPRFRPRPVVSPAPNQNQQDAVGIVSRETNAKQVLDAHRRALRARRKSDLIREKLTLHVDGTGDLQFVEIFDNTRIDLPADVAQYRKTENLLRPIVDNAVAHHTTMPIKFFADSLRDRRSRDRAMIDTLWINHLAQEQDFNGLFAEAMYLAIPAGFCPVHAYWREDTGIDWYEPIGYGGAGQEEGLSPENQAALDQFMPGHQGMIDCWVGNPFDTVFDRGAKRNSIRWFSYGRVLPADLVREHFGHVPGVEGLEGTTRISSAAEIQRIAKDWMVGGAGLHGDFTMGTRPKGEDDEGDELLTVICQEIAPGGRGEYAEGRLRIIAVPGDADLRRDSPGDGAHAVLLADQPLPARSFSATNFYSHHRGSDVHGKPWVEDIDQLQVDLNIALSKRHDFIERMFDSPLVTPGGVLDEDMRQIGDLNVMELDPGQASAAGWRPRVIEWPQSILIGLNTEITEKRNAMWTIGGYQAASRGESPGSRTPYRSLVAMQQADNTIHGPVNMKFRRSACDFARRCWSQMKTYGDEPWLLAVTGDDYAHLIDEYVDKTKLSDRPPAYKLVNAFGPSPELMAQEILELSQVRGGDGQPFLLTSEARRAYPNQMLFDERIDPTAVQKRRARAVVEGFHIMTDEFRTENQYGVVDVADPTLEQAAQAVFQRGEVRFRRMQSDLLPAHVQAYTEIVQDETVDPLTRRAMELRLEQYYAWQQQMAMAAAGQAPPGAAPGGAPDSAVAGEIRPERMDPRRVEAEMRSGGARSTERDDGRPRREVAATAR